MGPEPEFHLTTSANHLNDDATEIAMRAVEASKFPVQQMVTHTFPLDETEKCIRAVGGEIPGLYPVKALIKDAAVASGLSYAFWSNNSLQTDAFQARLSLALPLKLNCILLRLNPVKLA